MLVRMERDEQVIGAKIEAAAGKPIEWCDLDFLRLSWHLIQEIAIRIGN